MKLKSKRNLIIILGVLFLGIGTTLAYFQNSTTLENLFSAGGYKTVAHEEFVSPSNWMPGDVTPKTVIVTNEGDGAVNVRMCIEDYWIAANNDRLPNHDSVNNIDVALINTDNTSDWSYADGCYYYNDELEPNETTSSPIQSVTFNPSYRGSIECYVEQSTGHNVCESTDNGYDNAVYHLNIVIETIQPEGIGEWGLGYSTTGTNYNFSSASSVQDETGYGTFLKRSLTNGSIVNSVGFLYENQEYNLLETATPEENFEIIENIFGNEVCSGEYGSYSCQTDNLNIYLDVSGISVVSYKNGGTLTCTIGNIIVGGGTGSPMALIRAISITGEALYDTSSINCFEEKVEYYTYNKTYSSLDELIQNSEYRNFIKKDIANHVWSYKAGVRINNNEYYLFNDSNKYQINIETLNTLFGADNCEEESINEYANSYTCSSDLLKLKGYINSEGKVYFTDFINGSTQKAEITAYKSYLVTTSKTMGDISYIVDSGVGATNFEKIKFMNNKSVSNNAIGTMDLSNNEDESVIGWYTDEDLDGLYELYIGADGKVIYKSDKGQIFSGFKSVEELDINNLDISQTNSLYMIFYGVGSNSQTFRIIGLDNWDTSNVTNFSNMFNSAGYNATTWNIGDLSNWDTSNVINMEDMFSQAGYSATTWNIGNLSSWDTSNVYYMDGMFSLAGYSATTWNIGDLSNWDTSKVTNMYNMFYCAGYSATTWNIGDLSDWDTSNVTSMSSMFNNTGYNATTWNIGDLSNWDTSEVESMGTMFFGAGYNATTWDIGDLSNWDTSNVYIIDSMFSKAGYSATTWNIGNLSDWNTSNVGSMRSMFSYAGYSATTWDIGDLSNWDTSNVTDMSSMFYNAGYNATTWDIGDLSNWDTSNVTDMSSMFYNAGYNATTWNSIGTINIHTQQIKEMFYNCRNAKVTLNLYTNPSSKDYKNIFTNAATTLGSLITVNYSSAVTNIDNIIATKSGNSNVVKGSLLD